MQYKVVIFCIVLYENWYFFDKKGEMRYEEFGCWWLRNCPFERSRKMLDAKLLSF